MTRTESRWLVPFLILIACVVARNAIAGDERGSTTSSAERAQIDTQSSRVYVFVDKTGLGHQHAVLGRIKSGAIALGATDKAGQIVFDMARFDADSDEARRSLGLRGSTDSSTRRKVNTNMFGAEVLDVRRYPTAIFDIHSAQPLPDKSSTGHTQYRLSGTLTLHGVPRPFEVDAEAIEQDQHVRLRGAFYLWQTHFSITPISMAFGTIGVGDRLTVHGEIVLTNSHQTAAKTGTATQ
ncbi:MAG: hypothetical protein A2W31_11930 [Planctomycetes bacterium RBG_16_64_10]|nr:MAG: hypothetical protein A2W31_11930 [Planctomycetes bacterium RBG_16_64_10]